MKHLKNLQSKIAAATAKQGQSFSAAGSDGNVVRQQQADAEPAAPDELLRRLLEAAGSEEEGGAERVVRAKDVGEMELQELAGRLFVLLFRASSSGAVADDLADDEDQVGSRLKSARALIALLQLLPALPLELASFYLSSLHALLSQSVANVELACSAGCVGPLLHWLPRLLPGGDCASASADPAEGAAASTDQPEGHQPPERVRPAPPLPAADPHLPSLTILSTSLH